MPAVLNSTFTTSSAPRLVVQACFCVVLNPQLAPALGVVSVMNAGAIVKFTLLTPDAGPLVQVTRMRACAPAVAGPATRQSKLPAVAVEFCCAAASTSGYVTPPSRLNSILTDDCAPRLCFQVTTCADPMPT